MKKVLKEIEKQIKENLILLYMKGSPKDPKCGFSAQAVQILNATCINHKYSYVNILERQDIRLALPKFAKWPTFPQLWVEGNLIGGCDILVEMYRYGELQILFKKLEEKKEKCRS